jgi:putative nucleotidyltransferase with HDIG domain
MIKKVDIVSIFSKELNWIKDKDLRKKVVEVWKEAAVKRKTNIAKAVYDQRTEDLNLDYLIAGALLHDVGKLLEFVKIDDKFMKSVYGKKFRHPVSGAKLAKELGLPDEVILIIHAHSYEGDKLKRSTEAVIVNHSDFIDFDIKKSLV